MVCLSFGWRAIKFGVFGVKSMDVENEESKGVESVKRFQLKDDSFNHAKINHLTRVRSELHNGSLVENSLKGHLFCPVLSHFSIPLNLYTSNRWGDFQRTRKTQ